ncbi:hypothetical protein FRC06_008047 [Ceratobasidium sp. 370]|nr:hypothetical protein FRC06_008047 [Ceratobasidium sp. 370]
MQTFARLFSIVTFLLSLGFIAQALPTPAQGAALAAREYGAPALYARSDPSSGTVPYGNGEPAGGNHGHSTPDVLAILLGLKADIDPMLTALVAADTVVVAKVQVDAIVVKVKAVVAVLPTVLIAVDAEVKAKIAALFVEIFVAIISACASVSVKLGVSVCLSLWAQIDVCLHLLLLALNVCLGGFISIVAKLCLDLDASVFVSLKLIHLDLCVALLTLVAKVSAAVVGIVSL